VLSALCYCLNIYLFIQVLANRPDIIREDYMSELCILQDDVPPFANQVYGYLQLNSLAICSRHMSW
jgi:hypothetical protein